MSFTVTFDLDSKATRTGGGELIQTVASGGTAVAPTISVSSGFIFVEWDTDLGPITADTTIEALYKADNNIYTICDLIASAIQADSDLIAYCTSKFGKQPDFFVGFDAKKLPEDSQLPFITVVPSATRLADNVYEEHSILVGVVCEDDGRTTASKVTRFAGYKTISDFERLVFDAIQAYLDETKVYYSLLTWAEANYQGYYPEYHATREIVVTTQAN